MELTKKIVLAKVREVALGHNFGAEPRPVYLSLAHFSTELKLGLEQIAEALEVLRAEHEIVSFELQSDVEKKFDKTTGTVKDVYTPLFFVLVLLEGKNWRAVSQLFFNVESGVLRYEDNEIRLMRNSPSYKFVSLLFSEPKKLFTYKEIADAIEYKKGKNVDVDIKGSRLIFQRYCGDILKPIRKKLCLPENEFFIANKGYSLIQP